MRAGGAGWIAVPVDGQPSRITLTHPDRVMYPKTGFTKAGMADYYRAVAPMLLPHVHGSLMLLALAALFGAASGVAFVAISAGLAVAAPPAARGLVMGGYSTALYLGFGIGSIALGPVIGRHGHAVGFALGGALGTIGTAAGKTSSERSSSRSRADRTHCRVWPS